MFLLVRDFGKTPNFAIEIIKQP